MWHAIQEDANQRNVLKHVPSSIAKNKYEPLKLILRDNQHETTEPTQML
jgi:hypothetical protein